MNINSNLPPAGRTQKNTSAHSSAPVSVSAKPAKGQDSLEFSLFAELVNELKNLPDLRHDIVAAAVPDVEDPAYPTHLDLQALGHALAQELSENGQFL